MNKSWRDWVEENVRRGCDRVEMCEILKNNKFKLHEIKQLMAQHFPPEFEVAAQGGVLAAPAQPKTELSTTVLKSTSVLEIQRDLSRLNPKAKVIEKRSGVSGAEFLEKYYSANRPVILQDLMTFWEAPTKWTPEYLKSVCGEENVEIMASRNSKGDYEIDDAEHRKQIQFGKYVDMVVSGQQTNDYYLTARNDFFSRPAVRPLLKDIEIFTEYLKETQGEGVYLWFGPKGTITPLHHDAMNIFMAQVQGRKHVKLIPANEIELVYNHFAVYSQVDIYNPDYARFPKFQHANIIDVDLEQGEVLFLPVGWWHSVVSLEQSITISFNNFLFPNEFKWNNPGPDGKVANY